MSEAKEQQASDMVERIARALFDAENIWRDMQQGLQGEELPERHFKVAISEYRMKARAAITAMRTPTEDMIYNKHVRVTLEHVWEAMIDIALSGSSVGHQIQSVAPVLSPAAVSDLANEERHPELPRAPLERSP